MQNRDSWKEQMNYYGKNRVPFLFMIDFCGGKGRVWPLPVPANELLYHFPLHTNAVELKDHCRAFTLRKIPLPYEEYRKGFQHIQEAMASGTVSLVNYTRPTPLELDLTLEEIFFYSKAKYRLLLKEQWVCFSPEPFIRIKEDRLFMFPMKGTIDASLPHAETCLLEDTKEIEEHRVCVEGVCDELKQVCDDIRVEKFRYIERVQHRDNALLQVSSCVSGCLTGQYQSSFGDLFSALLPAASIAGIPKKESVQLINAVEGYERGFYTGVAGVFDGQKLDSGVLIRFIEQTEKGFVYKSGGGITAASRPEKEYQELIDKVYVPVY